MDKVSIFVHEKGKFLYFREKDNMPNNYMIDPDLLQFSIRVLCVVYSEQRWQLFAGKIQRTHSP